MDIQVIMIVALTLLSTQADKCFEDQHCSNCTNATKYCNTECFPGYFGFKCKLRCTRQCTNRKCSLTLSGIGKCSEGCVPGFYGPQCNIKCTLPKGDCTQCPGGCDGTFCSLTASCVSGCHDQYYGSSCKNCSPRCRHCNRITGRCDVCHDPYHGLDCEYSCEHCSTTDCVQTCAPGLYGQRCSLRCNTACLSYPTAVTNDALTSNSSPSCISECQRYSGECINGCVDDWTGPHCSSPIICNPNCLSCNETGACVEGCMSGYYGDDCKPCPRTCFNHTCYPNNGSCDNGCTQGHYGQSCQLPCINCPGGACHPSTGTCIQGSTVPVLELGLSTGCVLLIVGIICVFVFHFRRRRQTTERDQHGNESIHTERSREVETEGYYTKHRYWEIDDYDEISDPQGQQQGTIEEEDSDEVSEAQEHLQGPAVEEDNSDPALPPLADYFPGPHGSEDDDGIPVLPVLADNFPGAQAAEDNNDGDASSSSAGGSQSYTPLMRGVFVDDARTVVTYISPTEDNT